MNTKLSFSLITIAFIIGLSTGFAISPEYQTSMEAKNSPMKELGNPDKFLDQRYLNNMIAHHLSAIDLCEQVLKNSKRPELQELAKTIIKLDTEGIKSLYQYKKDWYKDERKVTNFSKVNLGKYDEKFDLRFLNAFINHHDEAIMGAKEIKTKSTRNEILNLSDEVIQILSTNKDQLLKWRQSWYQI